MDGVFTMESTERSFAGNDMTLPAAFRASEGLDTRTATVNWSPAWTDTLVGEKLRVAAKDVAGARSATREKRPMDRELVTAVRPFLRTISYCYEQYNGNAKNSPFIGAQEVRTVENGDTLVPCPVNRLDIHIAREVVVDKDV